MANSDIILEENRVVIKGELNADSIRINQSPDRNGVTINHLGIHMFKPDGLIGAGIWKREGILNVGGEGAIHATNLTINDTANIEKINSSHITLGGSGLSEHPQYGRISMVNAQGKLVLTIYAGAEALMIVPGFGDLIGMIKELQQQVKELKLKVDQL